MSNYPDNTWDADPRAPWNQPEPWEGRHCKECKYFCDTGLSDYFCLYQAMREQVPIIERVENDDCACECFEV